MKEFNVTGTCIPEVHYMVQIDNKIEKIIKLIDKGKYFTINRPRQYGKTTTILMLSRVLAYKYIVIKTSFEGVGDDMFGSEEAFCRTVFDIFARSVRLTNKELYNKLKDLSSSTNNFNELSDNITEFLEELDKETVLIIDEVDKSSANRVFMQFLGVLRNKYLAMSAGEDLTFKSVILGGVHDIKNLKLKIRDGSDRVFNSQWNIAADFRVDMSFSLEEIKTMLDQYVNETKIRMDTKLISEEIRKFTNGYPYLVSRLCKNIDEYLDKNWTLKGVEEAVKMTLNERSTLFDDVIKNIENNQDIKAIVNEILVEGREIQYNPIAYEKGLMYGILTEINGKIVVHNKIFENLIYDYLIAKEEMRKMYARFTNVNKSSIIENDSLNMKKVLTKFQEFMYQEYRQEDERF